ncbi:MAG: hypothetical protein ACLGH8_00235 [Bacteroidia bacterium]
MKSLLKITAVSILFYCNLTTAQDMKYYTEENGKLLPTTKVAFEKSIDHSKNVDVYLENNEGQIGVLYIRRREGKLDAEQMTALKKYLKEYSRKDINKDEYIVIDYITAAPVNDSISWFSIWNKTSKHYTKKINRITSSKNFVVYNMEGRTRWIPNGDKKDCIADKNNVILKLFFVAQANYGNAAVIRPDGTYITHLGEYGPDEVYNMIKTLKAMP